MFFPKYYHYRSQDLCVTSHDAGQFYREKFKLGSIMKINENSFPLTIHGLEL